MFWLLPLIANVLTVCAFALLARTTLPMPAAQITAVLVFGLLPRSFQWLIMGGGVTRSLGALFGIIAIRYAHVMYQTRQNRHAAAAALFAGLAILSHLEWAWCLFYSLALLAAFSARSPQMAIQTAGVAFGAGVVSAPWWATIIYRFGIAPSRPIGSSPQFTKDCDGVGGRSPIVR